MSPTTAPAPYGVRYLLDRAGVSSFAPEGLRWLVADRSLELRTTATSHDGLDTRAAIINCGIALHQMQVVFAAHGVRATVTIGDGEDVFATVTPIGPHAVSADDTAMYEALLGNASPETGRDLGAGGLVALLSRAVREYGVAVQVFDDTTARFLAAGGAAGICAKTPRNAPRPVSTGTVLHLTLITGGDTPADWMHAGQALSATMLTCAMLDLEAAIGGMAETAGARALLRSLAACAEQPQLWMEVTAPHSPPAHAYQPCAAPSHTPVTAAGQ